MAGTYDNAFFPVDYNPERYWPNLYWPRFEEEPPTDVSVKCADTVAILEEWQETLTIWRHSTQQYDDTGLDPQTTWTQIETFEGDWQSVDGRTMRKEAKLSVKSRAIIISPCGVDVEADDRIYKEDGTYMYVNYVREYEDHITIYMKREAGSY
jgi:hypothetical protein